MRRGEVWTVAGGPDYAGKPRPAVIIQEDGFATGDSATLCPLTSDESELSLIRTPIQPTDENGLRARSRVMVDKVSTVPRTKLGSRIGRLSEADMKRVDTALLTFLGLST